MVSHKFIDIHTLYVCGPLVYHGTNQQQKYKKGFNFVHVVPIRVVPLGLIGFYETSLSRE